MTYPSMRTLSMASIGILCASLTTQASGATINEDFESYTITTNGTMEFSDQSGNWNVIGPDSDTNDYISQDTTTVNGSQILDLSVPDRLLGVRSVGFDNIDGTVYASIDARIPTSEDFLQFYFTDGSKGTGDGFKARIRSAQGIEVVDQNGASNIKDSQGDPVSSAQAGDWYRFNITMDIDPNTTDDTYDVQVKNLTDNQQTGSLSGNLEGDPANIGRAYMYASGNGDSETGQYDNVYYGSSPIPDPSSLALLGLGGTMLILRRRRQ